MQTTTIEISDETWHELDRRKGRGESFNDVIQQLLDLSPVNMPDEYVDPPTAEYQDHKVVEDSDEQCIEVSGITGERCGNEAKYHTVFAGPSGDDIEWAFCSEHFDPDEVQQSQEGR